MFFRIASDLHLEFWKPETVNPNTVLPPDPRDREAVLLLAGDIVTLNKLEQYLPFFRAICPRFRMVCYTFGNHEYYHNNFENVEPILSWFREQDLGGKLAIMNNGSIEIDDISLWAAPLWTDMNNNNPITCMTASGSMPEFRGYVQWNDFELFNPARSSELHRESLESLEIFFENNNNDKVVIMTHHAPSFQSVNRKFKGSQLNPAFASELDDVILHYNPNIWVHGHMHDPVDYMIGDTRIIANPMGYPREEQDGSGYNPNLFVEI